MKNKKQNKKQNTQVQKESLSKMTRDKNFIVGFGVLAVLLFALGFGLTRSSQFLNQNEADVKNPLAEKLNTVENENTTITPTLSVTDLSGQDTVSTSSANVIKELPNTAGFTYHTVSANENFWKISKRVCGSGIYYLSIKQYNGYQHRTLRPGDVITVVCE